MSPLANSVAQNRGSFESDTPITSASWKKSKTGCSRLGRFTHLLDSPSFVANRTKRLYLSEPYYYFGFFLLFLV